MQIKTRAFITIKSMFHGPFMGRPAHIQVTREDVPGGFSIDFPFDTTLSHRENHIKAVGDYINGYVVGVDHDLCEVTMCPNLTGYIFGISKFS